MWKPKEEGITHINAYFKSKTPLGKLLSNFARVGIHTKYGSFESIEGLWYWLLIKDESLRTLYGWQAKENFIQTIKEAIDYKIEASLTLKDLLTKNTLPIVHYYSYGGKVVEPKTNKWVWKYYEEKSEELKDKK